MKLTSFKKAKACYDAGIKLKTTECMWKCNNEYYNAVSLPDDAMVGALDFLPIPSLDEWLDWLPKSIVKGESIYRKTIISYHFSARTEVGYKNSENEYFKSTHYSSKNLCDACADLAIWLVKEESI